MSLTETDLRVQFFTYLFEEREGWLCIGHAPAKVKEEFEQKWFAWPDQKDALGSYIENIKSGNNVWFGVNLFKKPSRHRDNAIPTRLVWADLDYCDPSEVSPPPQCRIESSPRKFQALWRLSETIDPEKAQALSKRIAYAYASKGADKSGWDIEQLLRVPFTYNYKYDDGARYVPEVKILSALDPRLSVEAFDLATEDLQLPEERAVEADPMPDPFKLPDVGTILAKYQNQLRDTPFRDVFTTEPNSDWSSAMWHLLNICLEAGMSKEETFAIALASKCNKYDRDDRPISYLWKEIAKAELKHKDLNLLIDEAKSLEMPTLLDATEPPDSVINDYKEWAVEATDAVEEFHELACTMLMSALLSGGLFLTVGYDKIIPNLWGLLLGDSTLTRKTTAMKMAMEFLADAERGMVVATDGSAEGLLTAIAARPGKVSVYFKDEITGFIDSINRKDYLAGMPEVLTQLYDVPPFYTRPLRKETITITNPVFIFFGGGIREKMYQLLNENFILSGFLPRFLVVNGDADLSKLRPTGPLVPELGLKRRVLQERFSELYQAYSQGTQLEIPDANTSITIHDRTEVTLTDDAWTFYQTLEMQLAKEASESAIPIIAQPTFGRLAISTLKMGMLFAAARQIPDKEKQIKVELTDVQAAAWYTQKWGRHTVDLIQNVGHSAPQRLIEKVLRHIQRRPGTSRSEISRTHHLSKRELDLVIDTLEDRGQIVKSRAGNGYTFRPL